MSLLLHRGLNARACVHAHALCKPNPDHCIMLQCSAHSNRELKYEHKANELSFQDPIHPFRSAFFPQNLKKKKHPNVEWNVVRKDARIAFISL